MTIKQFVDLPTNNTLNATKTDEHDRGQLEIALQTPDLQERERKIQFGINRGNAYHNAMKCLGEIFYTSSDTSKFKDINLIEGILNEFIAMENSHMSN